MSSKFELEHKKLLKAEFIVGKTFKLVMINPDCEQDANFVIELRNRKLNNYLRTSNISLNDQMNYFKKYQLDFERGEQIYYKIFDVSRNTFNGIVRLTELNKKNKFCYESMVVKENISPVVPTDVVLAIYTIGFKRLFKKSCGPFPVSKKNIRVLDWHKKIGMTEIINEDNEYFYLEISSKNYFNNIEKYKKLGLGFVSYEN
jgi:hypothetical protein